MNNVLDRRSKFSPLRHTKAKGNELRSTSFGGAESSFFSRNEQLVGSELEKTEKSGRKFVLDEI